MDGTVAWPRPHWQSHGSCSHSAGSGLGLQGRPRGPGTGLAGGEAPGGAGTGGSKQEPLSSGAGSFHFPVPASWGRPAWANQKAARRWSPAGGQPGLRVVKRTHQEVHGFPPAPPALCPGSPAVLPHTESGGPG